MSSPEALLQEICEAIDPACAPCPYAFVHRGGVVAFVWVPISQPRRWKYVDEAAKEKLRDIALAMDAVPEALATAGFIGERGAGVVIRFRA